MVPQEVIIGLLQLLEYINDSCLRGCYSLSFYRYTRRCAVSAHPYEENATALSTTGTMTDLTGNVRSRVFRHVSISCFGSDISDKYILNYVTDQATNVGFLSFADLSFPDDVSQS